MKQNILQTKSLAFAKRIMRLNKYLVDERREYVLSKQILKSGTSVGANVEESIGGQSRRDFYSKLTIAYKEARETKYWIDLLAYGNFISDHGYKSLTYDCEEILKIIGSIQKTLKITNRSFKKRSGAQFVFCNS